MAEYKEKKISLTEFVSLMALMISLVALSIDAMLPALSQIGEEFAVESKNDNQLVISFLFLGLAVGQVIYGPVSDSFGRKAPIYAGLSLFFIGCILSFSAENQTTMLFGRFLQGLGAAGPRIVTVALIRDQYEGRAMARIMSLIMTVFIIVPALAPAIGQGILWVAHWRAIFAFLLLLSATAFIWFGIRQPETLQPHLRKPLSLRRIFAAIRTDCLNRTTLGYTTGAGLIFGAFIGYLNSSQQIFQELYGLGDKFAFYFSALALALGAASYSNAKLVERFGMRLLSLRALKVQCATSALFCVAALMSDGILPLWALMLWALIAFFCMGILFGNFNALAMEPLGHIAGVGAAFIGTITSFISLTIGTMIGQSYNGTLLPLIGGFTCLGLASLLLMSWAEHNKKT